MYIYLPGGIGSYAYILRSFYVTRDQRAGDRGDPEAVDHSGARGRRVRGVRAVARNTITDDEVVVEIHCWRPRRSRMVVQSHAGKSVVLQLIINYQVGVCLIAWARCDKCRRLRQLLGLDTRCETTHYWQ